MDNASEVVRAHDPCTMVIFGASGDLAARKLIPAFSYLHENGFLPPRYIVVGFARRPKSDAAFRAEMQQALQEHAKEDQSPGPAREDFLSHLFYVVGDLNNPHAYQSLRERLRQLESEHGLPGHRLYYLATAPDYFETVVRYLQAADLLTKPGDPAWTRVIVEKPFGHDRRSAQALNNTLRQILDESQIYRIDHYLGKETVQNILSFRFGNSIFEPLFNQKYVDHVQITVAERIGIEGRGGYYETAGALRDMVQNHTLQLLSLIAMEPPSVFEPDALHDEKAKLLRAIPRLKPHQVANQTVRGQYGPGMMDGRPVKGYRQEEGVSPTSLVETYVALRLQIENWRWMGVPFLLRSGKRLARRVSEIVVHFKQPPLRLFTSVRPELNFCDISSFQPNALIFHIQPDEGISLTVACKQPGMEFRLQPVTMDFFYGQAFKGRRSPEAYERLLLDALRGDSTLFTRSDTVDLAWRFVDSILEGWAALPPPEFPNYTPGSSGPKQADDLFYGLRACWRPL